MEDINVVDNEIINKFFYNDKGNKEKVDILNIASGKTEPLILNELCNLKKDTFLKNHNYNNFNLLNLDRMYLKSDNLNSIIEIIEDPRKNTDNWVFYYNHEIFDFLTRFQYQFDLITMYRFLEHVKKTDVLYFIYLLSTTVRVGGLVDVIVPDYKKLAKRILSEDPFDENFEADDIITTFEVLNEPGDPHSSIWTVDRIRRFFTLEGRFKINHIQDNYYFDGRDIYIRFLAERIK